MSTLEDLEKYCAEPPEQKLHILHRELMQPILTVQASARLFKQYREGLTEQLPADINPEELGNMIDWLFAASNDLDEILKVLNTDCEEILQDHSG